MQISHRGHQLLGLPFSSLSLGQPIPLLLWDRLKTLIRPTCCDKVWIWVCLLIHWKTVKVEMIILGAGEVRRPQWKNCLKLHTVLQMARLVHCLLTVTRCLHDLEKEEFTLVSDFREWSPPSGWRHGGVPGSGNEWLELSQWPQWPEEARTSVQGLSCNP